MHTNVYHIISRDVLCLELCHIIIIYCRSLLSSSWNILIRITVKVQILERKNLQLGQDKKFPGDILGQNKSRDTIMHGII